MLWAHRLQITDTSPVVSPDRTRPLPVQWRGQTDANNAAIPRLGYSLGALEKVTVLVGTVWRRWKEHGSPSLCFLDTRFEVVLEILFLVVVCTVFALERH